jgi:hypothetical protein
VKLITYCNAQAIAFCMRLIVWLPLIEAKWCFRVDVDADNILLCHFVEKGLVYEDIRFDKYDYSWLLGGIFEYLFCKLNTD